MRAREDVVDSVLEGIRNWWSELRDLLSMLTSGGFPWKQKVNWIWLFLAYFRRAGHARQGLLNIEVLFFVTKLVLAMHACMEDRC